MSITRAIQGNADGLCGMYALVNFLVNHREVERDGDISAKKVALFHVCEAAERIGLLTAQKILHGHPWPDLVEIFNELARKHYVAFTAVPLLEVCNVISEPTDQKVFTRVLKERGNAVVSVDRGQHWVLLNGSRDGKFTVVDPTYGEPRAPIRETFDFRDGVAILRDHSKLLEQLAA